MSQTMQKLYSIDVRKMRWNKFMKLDPDVTRMRIINCSEGEPAKPPLWPDKQKDRIEWVVRSYEWQMEQARWLHDDKIPHLDFLTGTEIFAEAFGCAVHRAVDNMPCALPLVQNAEEAARLKVPELFSSTLAYLFDMADEAVSRTGKGIPLRLPDIQSPMDIAALIWEKSDFYVAMIEEPEAVKELAAKVRSLLTSFLDEWFRRYGTHYIAHFPAYYMEGGLTLSEDEVGVVNPAMYEEFFLPELEFLSNRYGGLGMHCCADARHQWPGFLRIPGLRFLNLIQPKDIITEAYPYFHGKVAQWHGYMGNDAPIQTTEDVSPKTHPVWEAYATTKDEAIRKAANMLSLI